MPTHKISNDFIRKWNNTLSIKGYSKMSVKDKSALIEKRLKEVKSEMITDMRKEWTGITSKYSDKIKSNEAKRATKKKKENPLVKAGFVKDEKEAKLRVKQFSEEVKKSKEKAEKKSTQIVPVKEKEEPKKEEPKKEEKIKVNRKMRNERERQFKSVYKKTVYKVLGLPNKANPSSEELKKICRDLQRQNHPDKGGTTEKIQAINDACAVLMDTMK